MPAELSARHVPRRWPKATRAASALLLAVTWSACAAPRYTPPASVPEADRRTCAEFARGEASALFSDTPTEVKRVLSDAARFPPMLLLAPILVPLAAASNADNDARYQALYEAAMKTCVEPVVLAQTLGPEHPDVAKSLDRLAQLYAFRGKQAEAEALYRRALAIQERAPGPAGPELAGTLDHYAALLRQMKREPEAADLERRANAIRDQSSLPPTP